MVSEQPSGDSAASDKESIRKRIIVKRNTDGHLQAFDEEGNEFPVSNHSEIEREKQAVVETMAREEAPKVWKPHLEKFTLFPILPIEIRQAIWKTSLHPRAVEIAHSCQRGYYSCVEVPVALRVNKDSRNSVGFLYPLCFGNILHQPRIVFNFSMDTLYFDERMWTELPKFLVSLEDVELKQIQSIAVDRFIDEAREWDDMGYNPYDNMDCLKKAAAAMSALKEFFIVVKIDEMWHDHGFPDGYGTTKLFDEFPDVIQNYCFESHLDHFEWECDCTEKPACKDLLNGFDVPKKGSVWGWRPTKTKKVTSTPQKHGPSATITGSS